MKERKKEKDDGTHQEALIEFDAASAAKVRKRMRQRKREKEREKKERERENQTIETHQEALLYFCC